MVNTTVHIGLGSNLGDREAHIRKALLLIENTDGVNLVKTSSLMETSPEGGPPHQGEYLNGAAEITCQDNAESLLRKLQNIENQLGRVRREKWGPRTIDLDLLLFGAKVIDIPQLKIPHPLMHQRLFVMKPLVEIAPDLIHPVLGLTMSEILFSLERDIDLPRT